MPDLGSVGTLGNPVYPFALFNPNRPVSKLYVGGSCRPPELMLIKPIPGTTTYTAGAYRDDTLGNPGGPSQRQDVPGALWDIYWPVETGARTISIDCRQSADPGASLRPRLLLRGNSQMGVPDDLAATMDGTVEEWVTLTISVTVTVAGVLLVGRERRVWDAARYVNWDNVSVT